MTNPDDHASLAGDDELQDLDSLDAAPLAATAHDVPLDFDELLAEGRLVERVASIYLDGQLYADRQDALRELSTLVDENGQVLSDGDQALGDQNRAEELAALIHDLDRRLAASRRTVRFQAMPADEWPVFDRQYRPGQQFVDDEAAETFSVKIIARCAISPRLTEDQVLQLKKKLTTSQFNHLSNEAFFACITGGTDIPKSLGFSPAQKPPTSAQS